MTSFAAAITAFWLLPTGLCYEAAKDTMDEVGVMTAKTPPTLRIVHGKPADPCEWRWQVSFEGSCGGTLIAPSWIISAAHCKDFKTVTIGDYDITSDEDNKGKTKKFNVKRWINHPNYDDPVGNAHDFALVEIDGAVETNNCVGFAKLPSDHPAPGTKCFITGWGTLTEGGKQPPKLQEAVVTLLKNDKCGAYPKHTISDDMLCAQGENEKGQVVDACQGDSGGPLVCKENGKYVIHGATSWGFGCASEDFPGVYSRVYSHMDFIDKYLKETDGGTGCEDTDKGATDSHGDGCKWYTEFDPSKSECGKNDDGDFKAKDLCCHCGGGTGKQPTPKPTPDPQACKDTDDGAKDSHGDDCSWYDKHDPHGDECGDYDDGDFRAHHMCCRCGGGSTADGHYLPDDPSRLFETTGFAVSVAKARSLAWPVAGVAAATALVGIAASVAVARRAARRGGPGQGAQELLAAGSDAELTA